MKICSIDGCQNKLSSKNKYGYCKDHKVEGDAAYRSNRTPEAKQAANSRSNAIIKEKRERIQAIKVERGCADCGYNEHHAALDFDHVRGEKLFTIAQIRAKSWETIQAEIDKCDVVCANHHRIRTYERLMEKLNVST